MNYIVIDKYAAEYIIQQRELFSEEFPQSNIFLNLLQNGIGDNSLFNNIFIELSSSEIYILGRKANTDELQNSITVIDIEQSELFNQNLQSQELLQIIQKIIRFSIRYWNNLGFPSSEQVLQETQKAVLFPFSYSTSSHYKIVLERDADSKRTSKRGFNRTLLVYKANSKPAPSNTETPTLKNFRDACEGYIRAYPKAVSFFETVQQKEDPVQPVSVFKFEDKPNTPIVYSDYDMWLKKLSTPQRQIISQELKSPIKIQGPAGTGKTLTLILKAIAELKKAHNESRILKAVFITHSLATQHAIEYIFSSLYGERDIDDNQTIKICTLYNLFLDFLKSDISLTEILENDAQDAKLLQELYVNECYEKNYEKLFATAQNKLSSEFLEFLTKNSREAIVTLLMHEFAVQIKGRANGDMNEYIAVVSLPTGIPATNEYDKIFVYRLYDEYQKIFDKLGQFDSDDIALSAFSKLNTPIWKRRRIVEGYDCIFLDETHLFNINELQSVHLLTKNNENLPIVFAIDTAQAIGELACDAESLVRLFCGESPILDNEMKTVFRSTIEITNLSAAILSSGAQLFTSITNLYDRQSFSSNYINTNLEEELPKYIMLNNDELMCKHAIKIAREHLKKGISPSEICFISFADAINSTLKEELEHAKCNYLTISKRGDLASKKEAADQKRALVTLPDYVGGLEFDVVILLGVDSGRVPQNDMDISNRYFKYTAINKLYVSVSRARSYVYILGNNSRGRSSCLDYAVNNKFLDIEHV